MKGIKLLFLCFILAVLLCCCGKTEDKPDNNTAVTPVESVASEDKAEVVASDENVEAVPEPAEPTEAKVYRHTKASSLTEDTPEKGVDRSNVAVTSGIPDASAKEIVASMTLEQKIGQMFFVTPEELTLLPKVIMASGTTKQALEAIPVGGIVYFSQNLQGISQTNEMLTNTNTYSKEVCGLPMFFGIDEEGGTVTRIGGNDYFGVENVGDMKDIGETGDPENAYEVGKTIGRYLSTIGFNVDFAPVADVLTNEENDVVAVRSFGSDPDLVSKMAINVSKGLNSYGVYSCYKHFPGHGCTSNDSHNGLASSGKTLDELREAELVPFAEAVKNGADFIMVGHISFPNIIGDATPATMSSKIVTDILRNELNYNGIIITDAMGMGAILNYYDGDQACVNAIKAGCDMVLMPQDLEKAYMAVYNAVKNGEISEEQINKSVERIVNLKLKMDDSAVTPKETSEDDYYDDDYYDDYDEEW